MNVALDPRLKQLCPALALAWVRGSVSVTPSAAALLEAMAARSRELSGRITQESIVADPGVAALRDAYRALGKDPSRYRGSAEALLRRLAAGKELYRINCVVDVNNLLSLESSLSLGSYDVGRIQGDITFRIGHAGESYKGIGKEMVNIADLPVFADELGPFGSPTSDSERTKITPATRELGMMIISFGGEAPLQACAERAVALLTQHAAGSALSCQLIR